MFSPIPPPSSPFFIFANESNSSKIITHGDDAFALRKISLMAFSDSPTHFDSISGPLTRIMFPPLSVAKALAKIVFPHPGGPYNNAPFGGFIPILLNFSGSFIATIKLS